MKNKELIELITELKQQLDESRDTDFDNYVGNLSKRAEKSISELKVNNGVLDGVIKCEHTFGERGHHGDKYYACIKCGEIK